MARSASCQSIVGVPQAADNPVPRDHSAVLPSSPTPSRRRRSRSTNALAMTERSAGHPGLAPARQPVWPLTRKDGRRLQVPIRRRHDGRSPIWRIACQGVGVVGHVWLVGVVMLWLRLAGRSGRSRVRDGGHAHIRGLATPGLLFVARPLSKVERGHPCKGGGCSGD
jgi:hypothetical protein